MEELAADVSRDGNIFTFDAALIAQYSVGLPKLPASFVGEWIFLPENHSYAHLSVDQSDQDFAGILLGNVHGNWVSPSSSPATGYTSKKYKNLSDVNVEPGQTFEIPIKMPDEEDIISLNIELSFDPELVDFFDIVKTNLSEDASLFYNTAQNLVKIGIYSLNSIPKDKELFRLKFKAREANNQIGKISIDRFLLNEHILMTAQAQIVIGAKNRLPENFSLAQNYPNPFSKRLKGTTINFEIPKQTKVKLLIYNSLGQLVYTVVEKELPAGSYNVKWDGRSERGDILSSGIYLYRLITDEKVLLKKLLFLK